MLCTGGRCYHYGVSAPAATAPPTLRPGTPDDAPAVLRLLDEAVTWLVARGRSDQWGTQPWSEREAARQMVDRLAASPGLVVAVDHGPDDAGRERVVGALVVEDHPTSYVAPAGEPEHFVHLLVTSRSVAGRGIGAALLAHAQERCRRERVGLLRVDCFGGGERELVRWYEAQGFIATHAVDVQGWPAQVLEQRVARYDEVRTERLLMRRWRDSDLAPFAALNADPVVMEHFPATQERIASDATVERFERHLTEHGWGVWALERLDTGDFIGFTGLTPVPDDLPVAPGVEVGWRLAHAHWGQGFAPEAARAALRVGFGELRLPEVVSFTSRDNSRSQSVMRRIGLRRWPERDFDHPRFPDWPGSPHVVYGATAEQWRQGARSSAGDAGTVGP